MLNWITMDGSARLDKFYSLCYGKGVLLAWNDGAEMRETHEMNKLNCSGISLLELDHAFIAIFTVPC